jgi:hypothetical protein
MMPDATHYTYRVAWSVEDGEHVATVAEFPSLSWLAPTPVEALAGLADVVRDVLAERPPAGLLGHLRIGALLVTGHLSSIAGRQGTVEHGHRHIGKLSPSPPSGGVSGY